MSAARLRLMLGALVALTIALAPVKYLNVEIAGADLTAFRFALVAATLLAAVVAALDASYRRAVVDVVRSRYFLAAAAFSAWILISAVHGYLTAPTAALERRALVGAGSLVLTALVLPLVTLPALRRGSAVERTVAGPVRLWQALFAFAFVQVALHAVGLPINSIEIGTPRVEPAAPLFGVDLLRPFSLVGEPRDLASMAIALLVAGAVLGRSRRLTWWHGAALGLLGVLLASFTFYLVLAVFSTYYLIFERRSRLIEPAAGAIALLAVVLLPLASTALTSNGTRVVTELGNIAAQPPPSSPGGGTGGQPAPEEEPEPLTAAFNQAPDLLADDYAIDVLKGHVSATEVAFGNGVGSFTPTINRYYKEQFGHDLVRSGEIVNSRLFPFGLLIEAGLVGIALFGWLILEVLRALQRSPLSPERRGQVRVLVAAFVLASLVQVSVLFGVAVVLGLAVAWQPKADDAGA
jgi:hypothetical protein